MPKLKLSTRLILVITLLVLLQMLLSGLLATRTLQQSLEEQVEARILHLARLIAEMPSVQQAIIDRDSEQLNQLVDGFMLSGDMAFVTIGDHQGIRLAHPFDDRLGLPMQGGDNDLALLQGLSYVSEAEGSLGRSLRGKAAVFDTAGRIIGVVSVGYLREHIDQIIQDYHQRLMQMALVILLLSVLLAVWISRRFKAAIYGLEPEQIAQLLEERDATLESLREGMISVNAAGIITTMNRAALEILHLQEGPSPLGQPVSEVLPNSPLLELLASGQSEYDRPLWRHGEELIANFTPMYRGQRLIGAVSSFRRKTDIDQMSQQLTQVRQYADSLRSQTHEYMNKLHTLAGLIQIGATDQALALIGQETQEQQNLIQWLTQNITDPLVLGCILGKYNRAHELGLELVLDPESDLGPLPAHIAPEQLVTLLGNLLDNAFEANLQRDQKQVFLSIDGRGQEIILEIEDQGPGIAPSEQERIFERGYSHKQKLANGIQHHGIGLQLVRATVSQLGGEVTLVSHLNTGSRFTVYLPKEPGDL
ncbi:ATP-binding protein [Marinospirillum sp.]|uniref:ATP-binding protein n=1 Tax=Marinospirillum sp. TaxID=2183934 RepID=UPI003A8949E0